MSLQRSTIERAEKEGKVLIYGTVEKDEFAGWKKAFERKYPSIEIDYRREYVYGTPPPMAKKIMQEIKEGKETADAVIATVPPMMQIRELNLISKVKLEEAEAYPEDVRQKDGYWFPIVSIPIVQIYNPKLVSKKELPKTALDLTSPKWKDAIVLHDMTLGTLGAYWLASLRPIFGEKKWGKFVHGLAANKPKAFPLYDNIVDSVTSGETRIGLTTLLHDLMKAKEAKRNIARLTLKDVPILTSFNAIAKTNAGKHPASAGLVIDFLISSSGQKKIGSTYVRIPARPGIDAPYSIDKLVRKEKTVVFPNTLMLPSVLDSIKLFGKLFK
ncbi:MAG: extracellular solute-binding protein [Thaumarchaeota archaeon]|nr:extracellular solute-binding protein [Nitrososphaerota archaeon]